jgi:hypothetical protein
VADIHLEVYCAFVDFKVRMGFGLHAGWAIEGAVGSLQKVSTSPHSAIPGDAVYVFNIGLPFAQVDATYLSPHVNMAARLETSSRQYGVSARVQLSRAYAAFVLTCMHNLFNFF